MDNQETLLSKARGCNFTTGWLQKRTSVAEVESKHAVLGERLSPGYLQRWVQLKDTMRENDELWEYSSPLSCWRIGMGRAGYILMRDGDVIFDLLTRMN